MRTNSPLSQNSEDDECDIDSFKKYAQANNSTNPIIIPPFLKQKQQQHDSFILNLENIK